MLLAYMQQMTMLPLSLKVIFVWVHNCTVERAGLGRTSLRYIHNANCCYLGVYFSSGISNEDAGTLGFMLCSLMRQYCARELRMIAVVLLSLSFPPLRQLCSWHTLVLGGWQVNVQWAAWNLVASSIWEVTLLLENNDILAKKKNPKNNKWAINQNWNSNRLQSEW